MQWHVVTIRLQRNQSSVLHVSIFFFSSRRRHTRLQGDWSSDVCSSDLDDFLDVIAGRFIRVEKDVDLIDSSKKIVQVAHDVLVGAHKEEAEVIRLELEIGRASCRERV